MKKYLLLIVFCISTAASAQYNRYGNGRIGGVDRTLNGQAYERSKKKKEEKIDYVELSMKKLEEDLKLDSFQSAVIKQLLEANQADQNKIIAEDIPEESKIEKIMASRAKLNDKIKEYLRPDQLETFEALGKKKGKK